MLYAAMILIDGSTPDYPVEIERMESTFVSKDSKFTLPKEVWSMGISYTRTGIYFLSDSRDEACLVLYGMHAGIQISCQALKNFGKRHSSYYPNSGVSRSCMTEKKKNRYYCPRCDEDFYLEDNLICCPTCEWDFSI